MERHVAKSGPVTAWRCFSLLLWLRPHPADLFLPDLQQLMQVKIDGSATDYGDFKCRPLTMKILDDRGVKCSLLVYDLEVYVPDFHYPLPLRFSIGMRISSATEVNTCWWSMGGVQAENTWRAE